MNRHWREKRQCLSPAFFFVLEKGSKSAGNAVIPTFPTHWSHGLQHLRHKRLTFAFTGESGYTLAFASRSAHSGSHAEIGVLPPVNTAQLCATNRIALNATFAILDSATLLYTYISRFSVNPNYQQREKIRRSCRHKFYSPTVSHPAFQLRSQTALVRFHGRKWVTRSAFGEGSRTRAYTAKQGVFRVGGGITTLGVLRVLLKRRTAACQSGSFAVSLCPLFTFVKDPAGHCQYPH